MATEEQVRKLKREIRRYAPRARVQISQGLIKVINTTPAAEDWIFSWWRGSADWSPGERTMILE